MLRANLNIENKNLGKDEKKVLISGFERAYGFGVIDEKVFIPDFISGLIYELDLRNKKTQILLKKKKIFQMFF